MTNDNVDGIVTNDDEWRRMVMNGDNEEQRWTVMMTDANDNGQRLQWC